MECPDCKGRGWAAHGVLGTGDCGRCGGSGELTSVTVIDEREALERIADRIEAGELVSEKSMSDREFLAPLLDEVRCDQCGDPMNPAARMLGPVCGRCCRRNQRAATG